MASSITHSAAIFAQLRGLPTGASAAAAEILDASGHNLSVTLRRAIPLLPAPAPDVSARLLRQRHRLAPLITPLPACSRRAG